MTRTAISVCCRPTGQCMISTWYLATWYLDGSWDQFPRPTFDGGYYTYWREPRVETRNKHTDVLVLPSRLRSTVSISFVVQHVQQVSAHFGGRTRVRGFTLRVDSQMSLKGDIAGVIAFVSYLHCAAGLEGGLLEEEADISVPWEGRSGMILNSRRMLRTTECILNRTRTARRGIHSIYKYKRQ